MRVVDTSAWIECLIGSALGAALTGELPGRGDWLVPTIVQLELAKWLTREVGEDKADQVIAFTETCVVADLDTAIALSAADLSAPPQAGHRRRRHLRHRPRARRRPAHLRPPFRRPARGPVHTQGRSRVWCPGCAPIRGKTMFDIDDPVAFLAAVRQWVGDNEQMAPAALVRLCEWGVEGTFAPSGFHRTTGERVDPLDVLEAARAALKGESFTEQWNIDERGLHPVTASLVTQGISRQSGRQCRD